MADHPARSVWQPDTQSAYAFLHCNSQGVDCDEESLGTWLARAIRSERSSIASFFIIITLP
jgi:hypothetical protein